MTRRRIFIALAAVAASVLLAAAYQLGLGKSENLGNNDGGLLSRIGLGLSGGGNTVHVSGNVELIHVDVSFKIPGRVIRRDFDEGECVEAGKRIAALESKDLEDDVAAKKAAYDVARAAWEEVHNGSRKEDKEAARAAKEKAEQAYKEMEAGSRPQEIEAALATLQSAEVEQARLADELGRAEKLYLQDRVLSEEDYRRQKAAYEVAAAKCREARERYTLVKDGPRDEQKRQAKAAWEQATWQCQLVENGARREVREQARARRDEAKAAWDLAKTRLSYAEVFAPEIPPVGPWKIPGPRKYVVMSKNVEPGEYVAAGTPVVTIGDLARPWLRAYIDEPDFWRVKYGQKARVKTSPTAEKSYDGFVGFISSEAEFTPKNVQTEKERTKLVYRIKIYIDNRDLELKRGMPADAYILLDSVPADEP